MSRPFRKTVAEIADIVGGTVVGDKNVAITGLSGIKEAREGDLAFLANEKYFPLAEKTGASAILTPRDIRVNGKTIIQTDDPSRAFARFASVVIGEQPRPSAGIHPTAVIDKSAAIGAHAYIGPHVTIEANVSIGDNAIVHSGCFIGYETRIGAECLLHPNVTVRERVTIGNRVIIHSGTVIGSDGFGYVEVEGVHEKVPQLGTVVIEDDVEVGANVAIDRARFDKTYVGCGTKIDNLVHIAHNVIIGERCIIIAQVGISGSTTVEKNAILAGQVGVIGHLTIGEGAIIAAQSGVSKSVPPHTQVFGSPAKPVHLARRVNAAMQRLPHYIEQINELKGKVERLEKKISDDLPPPRPGTRAQHK